MKRHLIVIAVPAALIACKPSATQEEKSQQSKSFVSDEYAENKEESKKATSKLDEEKEIETQRKLDNGLTIEWFEHGTGDKLEYGDMVAIDYKVRLANGEVVDGNHLLNKKEMPFMIGFQMQTKGWDIALRELRVGDFAEIDIPSELARGEKGISGLIPPNATNILRIRVLRKMEPDREVDGNKIWLLEENNMEKLKFHEGRTIEFHCMASSPSSPFFVNTFRQAKPFSLSLPDHGLVPGLKKSLINAKKSDRMIVFVPSSQAYGSGGYKDIVRPNEDLLYNLLVMNVVEE